MITGMNNIVGYEAKWGAITGNMSDQTDLTAELAKMLTTTVSTRLIDSTYDCNNAPFGLCLVEQSVQHAPQNWCQLITIHADPGNDNKIQIAIGFDSLQSANVYVRRKNGGTWTSWGIINSYKTGDVIDITGSRFFGCLTNGGTRLECHIPMQKRIPNGAHTIVSEYFTVRGVTGYIIPLNSTSTDYKFTVTSNEQGLELVIENKNSSAFTGTNNTPVYGEIYQGTLTV